VIKAVSYLSASAGKYDSFWPKPFDLAATEAISDHKRGSKRIKDLGADVITVEHSKALE
jgi:hypothetical protein